MADVDELPKEANKPYSVFSQEGDTNSLNSVDDSIQEWTAKPNKFGLCTSTTQQLIEVTQATNRKATTEACEFSSLAYICKRLNQDNSLKNQTTTAIDDISTEFEIANKFAETIDNSAPMGSWIFENMSTEECLGYISIRTQDLEESDILEISNTHSECVKALRRIHLNITERPLVVDKDENIHLSMNLETDQDRELMTTLAKIKLPEIYTLKITNFYENDEDLENFLSSALSWVSNLVLHTESFCVDFHDYLEKLQAIASINHLYLKGFLVDSEDTERLLANSNAQKITLESCNIAVDEEFWISSESNNNSANSCTILKSITLIDNEMDEESMTHLLKAIKDSKLASTVTEVKVIDCSMTQKQVDSIIKL